jgi:rhamnosyltransferase
MTTKPACSVIVRCYNEEKHIGRLLSGIMQQTVRDVEIIVVDSGSTDATVAIASRYPVRLLTIDKAEFSFGRSLNRGIEAATADFVVMASAHVYPVYRDWLAQMLRPFDEAQVALVYGRQRGASSTRYAEHRVFARWFPAESDFRQRHPFCNNANAAVRRELWRAMPYDEDLTGLEDLDWARRAIEAGHYLAYNAEAEIVHVHEETYRQVLNRYRREAIAFKRIFPEAHFSLLDFARLWTANVASDYVHALRDGALLRELGDIPRFRLMQFWGTYRGYAQHMPVTQQLRRTFYYPERRRPPAEPSARQKLRIRYDAPPGSVDSQ